MLKFWKKGKHKELALSRGIPSPFENSQPSSWQDGKPGVDFETWILPLTGPLGGCGLRQGPSSLLRMQGRGAELLKSLFLR